MNTEISIRKAGIQDSESICMLFKKAICVMNENKIPQWDELYPNQEIISEDILKNDGIKAIKLDAFSQNPYALRMYEKLGYLKIGEANWRKGLFYLYEKLINYSCCDT